MEEQTENRQAGRMVKFLLLTALLGGCAAVCAWLGSEYYVKKRLDTQLAKIHLAGEPLSFPQLHARYSTHVETDDALGYYTKGLIAIASIGFANLEEVSAVYHHNMTAGSTEQITDDMQKQVIANLVNVRPILAQFNKGARLPLSSFDMSVQYGTDICEKRLKHIQKAVHLLSLRTLQLSLSGNSDAAVGSVISLLKLGRIFDSEPMMTLYPKKAALIRLACKDITILLEHTRPSKQALIQLDAALAEAVPVDMAERAIIGERVVQIEIARNIFPGETTGQYLSTAPPALPGRIGLSRRPWARVRTRWVAGCYLSEMDNAIEAARLPWPQRFDRIQALFGSGQARMGTVAVGLARLVGTDTALVNCCKLAIAISRHHLITGKLPQTLQELGSEYIEPIPADPFTGQPLLYRQDGLSYTVYSVGTDRGDDGGQVVSPDREKPPADCGIRIAIAK